MVLNGSMTKTKSKEMEVVIYKDKDGRIELDVNITKGSTWLTQDQIAYLLGTNVPAISKHISNIYKTNELNKQSTFSKMEIVQKEGNRKIKRNIKTYNLDMVISVGYRVNSDSLEFGQREF